MYFNIDSDEGASIRGWLALDNPSTIPSIVVLVPGREEIVLAANALRPDIRDLGIHTTGQVGFEIDARLVPDLEQIEELTIVEAETRLPIFSRFLIEKHVEKKLFLFDCSVMPQQKLLNSLKQNFTLSYANSERFSLETMLVIINNHFNKSLFMFGRSNFNRYASFLNNAGYIRAALLRDPFEELAERLMFLQLLSKSDASNLTAMYSTGIEPLIAFARELPFGDPKALTAAFRASTNEQRQALRSPMTRVFGCNFDEFPERRHVPIALENLATMDVVGTRDGFRAFRNLLNGILGVNIFGEAAPISFASIQTLATSLSRIGIVVDLLDHDLALYSYVDEAVKVGLEGADVQEGRDTQTI